MRQFLRTRVCSAMLQASGIAATLAVVQICGVAAGAGATGAWQAPRTPDGHPDLQGIWSNATQTPLQRPPSLGAKQFYTDAELAALRLRDHDVAPADGDPGTYNQFWWEEGGLLRQTSLIVDPPDGRIPPLTAEGSRRRAARQALGDDRGDGPEARNLAERCITRGAPKLPGGYNNNFQIVQTPQHLMLFQEMIHEARIVPLDGRPHAPSMFRSYLGDSRGHWDGDTLVVETTNFRSNIDETSFGCCGGAGEHLSIVERLTLVDQDTIDYRYTVNDPATFTRPWAVSVPMKRASGQIFEYACHEGNVAMTGILRGRRAEEQRSKEPERR